MPRKLTLEEVKLEFTKRGYIPLFNEYKNATTKLIAKTKDEYKVITDIHSLKNNKIPNIVDISNPYTIENIKLYITLNKKPYSLLSTTYNGAFDKLELFCEIHGKFKLGWNDIQRNVGCRLCGIESAKNKNKLTLEDTLCEFKKRGYIPLFEEYNNNSEKLLAETTEGYKFEMSISHLKSNKKPPITHPQNKYSIYNIKLWMKLNNSPYTLLSKKYKNLCIDKLQFCCEKHGVFHSTWDNFKRVTCQCPICFKEITSGENSHNWKGGITNLLRYLRNDLNEWKQDSFIKYNYKCDITRICKNLVVHHLKGFDRIVNEVLLELDLPIYIKIGEYSEKELQQIKELCLKKHKELLGVCLCDEEHKLFHSLFGYGNNTNGQYKKFKEMRLKELNEEVK